MTLAIVTAGTLAFAAWALCPGMSGPSQPARSLLYARDDAAVPVRRCPSVPCGVVAQAPTGTAARMICFRDAEPAKLNYRSDRWFDMAVPQMSVNGWVHSSQVGRQTRVGRC